MTAWQGLLEELVRERRPALIGYATVLAGDRGDAERLVHDAVVETFGRLRSFPDVDAADAYVRRAIASTFFDRGPSRISGLSALPRPVAGAAAVDDNAAGQPDVRAALLTLARRQRACVVLRFCDDLTVADIAEALGLSDRAVKRYLSDGIQLLNAALGTAADPHVTDNPTAVVHVSGGRSWR